MMDELQKQYFTDEVGFAVAMKLLQQFNKAQSIHKTFEAFQTAFLDELDDATDKQSEALGKALDYYQAIALSKGNGLVQSVTPTSSNFPLNFEEKILATISEQVASRFPVPDELTSIPLEQAMENFLSTKRVNWNPESGMENVFRDEAFSLFLEAVDTRETGKLTKNDAISYRDAVLGLPKNRRKMPVYRNLSLPEILGMDVPEIDKIGNVTKKGYLDRISGFLDWMGDSGYCSKGINLPLRGIIKKKTRSHEERDPFSKEDLRILFNSNDYTSDLHDQPFKYWVPLILLLSGARANEICQLYTADIIQDEGTSIWVMHLNMNDSARTFKSLKKDFHERFVPIHPILIRLGFIRYVEHLRQHSIERVFSELPYVGMKNKYAAKLERWFNNTYTNVKNCNVKTAKKSLHSLRHNCINYLGHDLNSHEHQFAHMLGQTAAGGVTTKRYLKPAPLQSMHKLFSKITYEGSIDFKLIKNFEEQRFFKTMKQQISQKQKP